MGRIYVVALPIEDLNSIVFTISHEHPIEPISRERRRGSSLDPARPWAHLLRLLLPAKRTVK
jgi:hypothetical protein